MISIKLEEGAICPTRGTVGSAGYDLYANEDGVVTYGTATIIKTGVSMAIPIGYYGRIAPRSSLGLRMVDVGAGVVDSDYRGEISVILYNFNPITPFIVQKGMRIAQIIITQIYTPILTVVNSLDSTTRGELGFGSTGH